MPTRLLSKIGQLIFRIIHEFPKETPDGFALIYQLFIVSDKIYSTENDIKYISPAQQASYGLHLLMSSSSIILAMIAFNVLFDSRRRVFIDTGGEFFYLICLIFSIVLAFYCIRKISNLSEIINGQIYDE
jgi:hypothetical protein